MTKKRIVFFGILFIVGLAAGYVISLYDKVVVSSHTIVMAEEEIDPLNPTPSPDPFVPKNILLLGYGGGDHSGATLTDTMILVHADPREKTLHLISIPRDLWVPLPIEEGKNEFFKINHAYAIGLDDEKYPRKSKEYKGSAGGGNMAKYAVSLVTGQPIDHFVALNFQGFKNIIEIIGGVDVYVPYDFIDEHYPISGEENNPCQYTEDEIEIFAATLSGEKLDYIFECRYEDLVFSKGRVTMDGETALKFVRSRHSATFGSDFGRSLRQQALIVAVKDKLLSAGSLVRLIPILNQVGNNVQTDIDITAGLKLLNKQGISDIEVKTAALTTDNVLVEMYSNDGQYILRPRNWSTQSWKEIKQFVEDTFKE